MNPAYLSTGGATKTTAGTSSVVATVVPFKRYTQQRNGKGKYDQTRKKANIN